jgi:hypothetical protein
MPKTLQLFFLLILASATGNSGGMSQGQGFESDKILWRPTVTDRQACHLPEKLLVSTVARLTYMGGTHRHQVSVFKTELPNGRLAFAASILVENEAPVPPPRMECVWELNYSKYMRATELALGADSRAVRIDVENISGDVQIALVVGEIEGKIARLLSFRPSEVCGPELAPCWN